MPLFYLALLAVVQGLTEFLPVSSSAHLILLPRLTGYADQGLLMDVAVHIGTLFAVVLYFRKDVFGVLKACTINWNDSQDISQRNRRLGGYVVLASIPVILAGALMHFIVPDGIRSVQVIIVTTVVFGLLLGFADIKGTRQYELKSLSVKTALIIGLAQMLALIPGTSRSGITMTAALLLGFTRTEAARFSLLLGIPAIGGAGALGVWDLYQTGNLILGLDALIAAFFAFVFAYIAIKLMMRWLSFSGFMPFVIYRLLLGAGLLFFLMAG